MYEIKNFDKLIGTEGFSDQLLAAHFKLYQGYVENTNKLIDLRKKLSAEEGKNPQVAEINRRFGWEWNGMRLHELYFDNLNSSEVILDPDAAFCQKIAADFGTFEDWKNDFLNIATMRGIGWVVLYYDQKANKLLNFWINEHDQGHPTGGIPLLVLDVFEHAYLLDYGTNRADYLKAFWKAVNWEVVDGRFEQNKEF